jgi:hypothetical protein
VLAFVLHIEVTIMYGKHFAAMYTGSMVGSGAHVFAVWGYIIANIRNTDSSIELNPKILSTVIGEPIGRIEEAIDVLCAPDKHSRSKENDGRRMIQEAPFLYRVVNYAKYATIKDDDARREYMRVYMANYRKNKEPEKTEKLTVNTRKQKLTHVDVNENVAVDEDKETSKQHLHAAQTTGPCAETDKPILEFPITGKNKEPFKLTKKLFDEFVESFPGIDVLEQCRYARAWCITNPTKQKTLGGMPKFLCNWLTKAQNQGSKFNGNSAYTTAKTGAYRSPTHQAEVAAGCSKTITAEAFLSELASSKPTDDSEIPY